MTYVRYIAARTVRTVVLLFLILTVLFASFRMLPGSYGDILIGAGASQETVAALEEKWGLNDPIYVQYYHYLVNLVQLDAGTSFTTREPVWETVKPRLLFSMLLAIPGITVAYFIGAGLGAIMGTNRGSILERYGPVPLVFLGSFPMFFTSIFLVVIFAGVLDWFPTGGAFSLETQRMYADAAWWRKFTTVDFLRHFTLPFTAVVLRYVFLPSLIMRTSVVEIMDQGFTTYDRVLGLPKLQRFRHLAKHASLPVITLYPISMTKAISGLILVEIVFDWPGIGFTLVAAVLQRDFPVIQFVFFLLAVYIVTANFIVDLFYSVIDPRVRVGGEAE